MVPDCPLTGKRCSTNPKKRTTNRYLEQKYNISGNMNLAVKTVYLITNQKAKVKPFEDKVAEFPVKKNSVAMLCLSESVNKGEEFTKSIT